MVKEITKQVSEQCLKKKPTSLAEEELLNFSIWSNATEYFECIVNSYGEAAKKHGLDKSWSEYEQQSQVYFKKWKKCKSNV